ncbi:MAG: hypothetical protein ABI237_01195 [Ginsengibacter sp.]
MPVATLGDVKFFVLILKGDTIKLRDNAEDTVEEVEHYMDEFNSKDKGDLIDKLYVLKKMFRNLYGSEEKNLL